MQIFNTDDYVENSGVRILLYGASGGGKTVQISLLRNALIIDCDNGLSSISKKNRDIMFPKGGDDESYNNDAIKISNIDGFIGVVNHICANSTEYETIVLDSVSKLSRLLLHEYSSKEGAPKDKRISYVASYHDMINQLERLAVIDNLNLVVTAERRRVIHEITKEEIVTPSVEGSHNSNQLPHFFDNVWLMLCVNREVDDRIDSTRVIVTNSTGSIEAKTRGCELELEEYPNIQYLIDKLKGNI